MQLGPWQRLSLVSGRLRVRGKRHQQASAPSVSLQGIQLGAVLARERAGRQEVAHRRGREQQARALLLHDRRAARLGRALRLQLGLLARLRPNDMSLRY